MIESNLWGTIYTLLCQEVAGVGALLQSEMEVNVSIKSPLTHNCRESWVKNVGGDALACQE